MILKGVSLFKHHACETYGESNLQLKKQNKTKQKTKTKTKKLCFAVSITVVMLFIFPHHYTNSPKCLTKVNYILNAKVVS